jgi:hypothetical protein
VPAEPAEPASFAVHVPPAPLIVTVPVGASEFISAWLVTWTFTVTYWPTTALRLAVRTVVVVLSMRTPAWTAPPFPEMAKQRDAVGQDAFAALRLAFPQPPLAGFIESIR